jgi:hypothetical protein
MEADRQLVFKQKIGGRPLRTADHTYGFADQTKEGLNFVLPGTGGPVERTIGFEYRRGAYMQPAVSLSFQKARKGYMSLLSVYSQNFLKSLT